MLADMSAGVGGEKSLCAKTPGWWLTSQCFILSGAGQQALTVMLDCRRTLTFSTSRRRSSMRTRWQNRGLRGRGRRRTCSSRSPPTKSTLSTRVQSWPGKCLHAVRCPLSFSPNFCMYPCEPCRLSIFEFIASSSAAVETEHLLRLSGVPDTAVTPVRSARTLPHVQGR